MQIVRLWATANRKSSLRGHRSRTATDLAKRTNRSYRVSCYRRLSSRIVRSMISIQTSRAFRSIFSAGRTGCICEELQVQKARSSRFEKSPPTSGAARERHMARRFLASRPEQMPQYGNASRADSPCSGRTDSIHDSEPDLSFQDFDEDGTNLSWVPDHRDVEFDADAVLGYFLRSSSLLIVRTSFVDPFVGISSFVSGIADTECVIPPIHIIANS